ncbi:MAG TPA: diacylglycerol kinase family protein [Polyangiaceae bacterium]|nr:diacylglycerol kinase family protein [Polyangiaceae bacterium]
MNASEGAVRTNWLKRRLRSFIFAGRGVWLLRTEPNARIHLLSTAFALITGTALGLSGLEWALIVVAVALVLTAEALNTAVERLADALMPNHHPLVGSAKDLGAGAVLIAAVGAAVIGVLVLGPHLLRLYATFFHG